MAYGRITIDPHQMGGVPCIRHLRVPVATLVGLVSEGMTIEEVLEDYPYLEREDILEALAYAAESVSQQTLPAAGE